MDADSGRSLFVLFDFGLGSGRSYPGTRQFCRSSCVRLTSVVNYRPRIAATIAVILIIFAIIGLRSTREKFKFPQLSATQRKLLGLKPEPKEGEVLVKAAPATPMSPAVTPSSPASLSSLLSPLSRGTPSAVWSRIRRWLCC